MARGRDRPPLRLHRQVPGRDRLRDDEGIRGDPGLVAPAPSPQQARVDLGQALRSGAWRSDKARPPIDTTSATTISVAATANVTCMPVVTSAGLAVVMSAVAD